MEILINLKGNPVRNKALFRIMGGRTWEQELNFKRRMRCIPLYLYRRKRNLLKGERRWISIDGLQIPVAE